MKLKFTIIITIIFSFLLFQWLSHADQWQLSLEIKRGYLTIDGSWSIDIGNITTSWNNEERIIPFLNTFQIKDTSWLCSGHYTTLQFDHLSNWSSIINNQNIQLQTKTLTTIIWKENTSLTFGTAIDNLRGNIRNTENYINRSANTQCGTIGIYGATWDIKINIPANQEAGTYKGKIYFLLIDNN